MVILNSLGKRTPQGGASPNQKMLCVTKSVRYSFHAARSAAQMARNRENCFAIFTVSSFVELTLLQIVIKILIDAVGCGGICRDRDV